MLEEFKRDNKWSRCVNKLGQMKISWLISQTIGSLWSVQRGESFNDILKVCKGNSVWQNWGWENDVLLFREIKVVKPG